MTDCIDRDVAQLGQYTTQTPQTCVHNPYNGGMRRGPIRL